MTERTQQTPHDLGTRVQALTLLEARCPIANITQITGISKASIYRLRKIAVQRGYEPEKDKRILLSYIEDAPRSGRPTKQTDEVKKQVVELVSRNSTTRQYSTQRIAQAISKADLKISAMTVWRILTSLGYTPYKPTYKPGLTNKTKAVRLKWCLEHADWTLEDWKNVIWSDEISVTMGGQRGRIRVWRLKKEAYHQHVIRRRWKGFKQFMFWGCFSYDKKGPCHIWEDETPKEKKESEIWLEQQNKILEPICKAEWEIQTAMRRVRISRNMPGKKPVWKWNKTNGKLVRDSNSKGGIDWYRYYRCILEKKLLPFAKECAKERPGTVVQEDNAAPHAHHHQYRVYDFWKVQKLLWPGNSPDLSAIEPPWMWMKRETTKNGAATSTKQMKEDWEDCWEDMEQERIQAWIERIPIHIQEVIRLGGGNEYKEGKSGRRKNPDRVH
jgi:transposase